MATHSSVLAWRIPGTVEPGGLPSVGSQELDTTEVMQQQEPLKTAKASLHVVWKSNPKAWVTQVIF